MLVIPCNESPVTGKPLDIKILAIMKFDGKSHWYAVRLIRLPKAAHHPLDEAMICP
jgi:hypothetical protein